MPRFIKPLIRSPRYLNRFYRASRWRDNRTYRHLCNLLGVYISYKEIIILEKKIQAEIVRKRIIL